MLLKHLSNSVSVREFGSESAFTLSPWETFIFGESGVSLCLQAPLG